MKGKTIQTLFLLFHREKPLETMYTPPPTNPLPRFAQLSLSRAFFALAWTWMVFTVLANLRLQEVDRNFGFHGFFRFSQGFLGCFEMAFPKKPGVLRVFFSKKLVFYVFFKGISRFLFGIPPKNLVFYGFSLGFPSYC